MQALKTDNLELSLDDTVVQMSVTGAITPETLQSSFEWIESAQTAAKSANDNLQLSIEMPSENFTDLAEASAQFRHVGQMLRRAHEVERCAVITDSDWLRNSAKVEGAVIPGLKIMAFAPEERESAGRWLRDEPLLAPDPETPVTDEITSEADPDNPWDNFSVKDVNI